MTEQEVNPRGVRGTENFSYSPFEIAVLVFSDLQSKY
jgi:hypothetical protein